MKGAKLAFNRWTNPLGTSRSQKYSNGVLAFGIFYLLGLGGPLSHQYIVVVDFRGDLLAIQGRVTGFVSVYKSGRRLGAPVNARRDSKECDGHEFGAQSREGLSRCPRLIKFPGI
jgi:hypothetical protein